MGITRAPRDDDHLHQINLKPFFQLLDLDEPVDQAQGLWFLKEAFAARVDLALAWLEPGLPRVRQLLLSADADVRAQAEGLLQAIGPAGLAPPAAGADNAARLDFADVAIRHRFPPIRDLAEGLIVLLPGPERQAIVDAGRKALSGNTLGVPASGSTKDGLPYRGLKIAQVPETLAVLRIPAGAVITAVNGVPVNDAAGLLRVLDEQSRSATPRATRGRCRAAA